MRPSGPEAMFVPGGVRSTVKVRADAGPRSPTFGRAHLEGVGPLVERVGQAERVAARFDEVDRRAARARGGSSARLPDAVLGAEEDAALVGRGRLRRRVADA